VLLDEFANLLNNRANTFNRDFIKELTRFRFNLERRGKKNATEDFYQPTTRAGYTRDYPLTGRLRQSIQSVIKDSESGIQITLQAGGSGIDYAQRLEFGDSEIKPFFFLGRAVQAERDELPDQLAEILKLQLMPSGN